MNYFICGNESYNLKLRRQQLIQEYGGDTMNTTVFSWNDDVNMHDVVDDCQTVPFFADYKLVILDNPDFVIDGKSLDDGDVKLLMKYLEKPNETTVLVIYCEQPFDRRKKIVTELAKKMKYETYDQLSEEEFQHYVMSDLNTRKLKLDDKSKALLMERLPNSIENWKKELEKLALYPGKITREVVSALIARNMEDDVFELSNAVVNKNLSRAMTVYNDLKLLNKTDVQSMIGLLAYQFRFMCQVKILAEHGNSNYDIAQQLKAKEYRIKMTLKSAGLSNSTMLLSLLNSLAQLDQNIKMGNIDGNTGFELFLVQACRR